MGLLKGVGEYHVTVLLQRVSQPSGPPGQNGPPPHRTSLVVKNSQCYSQTSRCFKKMLDYLLLTIQIIQPDQFISIGKAAEGCDEPQVALQGRLT